LITKMVSLTLVIGAMFDTVAADVLVVVNNFVTTSASRSRKRHSTAAPARAADVQAVDVQIDSRQTHHRLLPNWLVRGTDLL
jgi:hypothetical protein